MGFQEMTTKKLHYGHGTMGMEDGDQAAAGGKKKAAAVWIAIPPLRPVKVGGRRRHGGSGAKEEGLEEVTTPTGEGCRIPAEAATCPPAPKKPRTAAVAIVADRRCNREDGEVMEFFRVPAADLESVRQPTRQGKLISVCNVMVECK